MADFTEPVTGRDRPSLVLLDELHQLREQRKHWECESRQRREQIQELCAEVERLRAENARLLDGERAWAEWKEAMTTAAARRLNRQWSADRGRTAQ